MAEFNVGDRVVVCNGELDSAGQVGTVEGVAGELWAHVVLDGEGGVRGFKQSSIKQSSIKQSSIKAKPVNPRKSAYRGCCSQVSNARLCLSDARAYLSPRDTEGLKIVERAAEWLDGALEELKQRGELG